MDHTVETAALLRESRDKQVGLRMPLAVDQRLDALVARATAAGERTTRRELLAAILCGTDLDGRELGEALRRFRTMTVGEAILDVDIENVVELVSHTPGPRAAR